MYREIKYVKWAKCWNCGLPIIIQVGETIPICDTIKCPRCGKVRMIGKGAFLRPSEIPTEWKEKLMQSIGFEGKDF